MKKISFVVALLLLLVAPLLIVANADENVTVYSEYLTDSNGYNYGANFYVDSNVNAQIYVVAYIQSRNNVNGDVISGTALLQPNEKHFRIGSFISSDQSKPWSVYVGAQWKTAN